MDFMLHWQQDLGIDWTKLSATVLSRASRVLTELKRLWVILSPAMPSFVRGVDTHFLL